MFKMACCNFPTKLLVLDDDIDFLESLQIVLSKNYKSICTVDAAEARSILLQNKGWSKNLLKEGISRAYFQEEPSLYAFSMNVSLLKEQVYNPQRFDNIAVVIIDFDMPKENGLEFIRKVDDKQIKIIMLTGKAQQDTVIHAFNEREIHRYISKGDPDYLKNLFQYIQELHEEFFSDFSKFILDSFMESEAKIFEKLSFISLFQQIVKDNKIVEYYLLDESGSFLLLDEKAKQTFLIIKSEEDLENFYELAKDDRNTPTEILDNLKKRRVMTHFKTSKEVNNPAKNWHFIDAEPLDESNEYYYAIIKNDPYFEMTATDIRSYQSYLNE